MKLITFQCSQLTISLSAFPGTVQTPRPSLPPSLVDLEGRSRDRAAAWCEEGVGIRSDKQRTEGGEKRLQEIGFARAGKAFTANPIHPLDSPSLPPVRWTQTTQYVFSTLTHMTPSW